MEYKKLTLICESVISPLYFEFFLSSSTVSATDDYFESLDRVNGLASLCLDVKDAMDKGTVRGAANVCDHCGYNN